MKTLSTVWNVNHLFFAAVCINGHVKYKKNIIKIFFSSHILNVFYIYINMCFMYSSLFDSKVILFM